MKNRKEEILDTKPFNREYPNYIHETGALNAMQEYADEFACAFAEFIAENYVPILQHQKLQYWQKNYQDKSKKYTTTELLEIFKKEINEKV